MTIIDAIENILAVYPRNAAVLPYMLVYHLAQGPYYRPVVTSFQDNPLANQKIGNDRRKLLYMIMLWIQTINNVAQGRNPEIYQAMKGK